MDILGNLAMGFGFAVSPENLLFALIGDPRFAWMGALSELIARIDQAVADGEAADIEIVFAFREEAAALIGEGGGESVAAFRLRHLTALQNEPEVGLATGRLRKALSAIPSRNPGRFRGQRAGFSPGAAAAGAT